MDISIWCHNYVENTPVKEFYKSIDYIFTMWDCDIEPTSDDIDKLIITMIEYLKFYKKDNLYNLYNYLDQIEIILNNEDNDLKYKIIMLDEMFRKAMDKKG